MAKKILHLNTEFVMQMFPNQSLTACTQFTHFCWLADRGCTTFWNLSLQTGIRICWADFLAYTVTKLVRNYCSDVIKAFVNKLQKKHTMYPKVLSVAVCEVCSSLVQWRENFFFKYLEKGRNFFSVPQGIALYIWNVLENYISHCSERP